MNKGICMGHGAVEDILDTKPTGTATIVISP